jgi:uracil-DNA glycosylase
MTLQQIQAEYDGHIRPDIESLAAEVARALDANPKVRPLFQGWRVFFGPVMARPKVLLIGINPGNGQADKTGQADARDTDFWGSEWQFEYTQYNYSLARETREMFAAAGLTKVLATATMKTNYCFLGTTQADELEQLTDGLGRTADGEEDLGTRVYRKSEQWLRELIALLNPQTVVCEGSIAYQWVRPLFPAQSVEEAWDKEKKCGYAVFAEPTPTLIGYSRFRSHICNKTAAAEVLRRFITP